MSFKIPVFILVSMMFVSLLIADPPHTREGSFVGGYGEVIYTDQDALKRGEFRRFILYLGHAFSDKLLFRSELEYEKGTELALEQAYVEWRFSPRVALRSGLLLLPTSRINLYHEPTYFFTNDRPFVDTYLIPSTWRELGVGLSGELTEGLSYFVYMVAGMNSQKFSGGNFIKKGRQGGGKLEGGEEADGQVLFNSAALTARLTYILPLHGLRLAVAGYYGGVDNRPDGKKTGAKLQILSVDAVYERSGFYFSFTASGNYLTNAAAINAANAGTGYEDVAEMALGANVVAGFNVLYYAFPETEIRLIPYYMFETVQLHYRVPEGVVKNPAFNTTYHRVGVALYPHDQVVFKANYTFQRSENNVANSNWFQLGVGYNF